MPPRLPGAAAASSAALPARPSRPRLHCTGYLPPWTAWFITMPTALCTTWPGLPACACHTAAAIATACACLILHHIRARARIPCTRAWLLRRAGHLPPPLPATRAHWDTHLPSATYLYTRAPLCLGHTHGCLLLDLWCHALHIHGHTFPRFAHTRTLPHCLRPRVPIPCLPAAGLCLLQWILVAPLPPYSPLPLRILTCHYRFYDYIVPLRTRSGYYCIYYLDIPCLTPYAPPRTHVLVPHTRLRTHFYTAHYGSPPLFTCRTPRGSVPAVGLCAWFAVCTYRAFAHTHPPHCTAPATHCTVRRCWLRSA